MPPVDQLGKLYTSDYPLDLSVKYIAPLVLSSLKEQLLGRPGHQSLLDIGCGNGSVLNYLRRNLPGVSLSYTGVDFLANSDNGSPPIRFFQKDLNAPFAEGLGRHDMVLSCEVIEHVIDTDHFIQQIRLILKDNGLLFLTTPNLASYLNRLLLLFGFQPLHTEVSWANPYLGRKGLYRLIGADKSPAAGHLRLFTYRALRAFLRYHGFEILGAEGFIPYEGIVQKFSRLFSFFPGLMPGLFLVAAKR